MTDYNIPWLFANFSCSMTIFISSLWETWNSISIAKIQEVSVCQTVWQWRYCNFLQFQVHNITNDYIVEDKHKYIYVYLYHGRESTEAFSTWWITCHSISKILLVSEDWHCECDSDMIIHDDPRWLTSLPTSTVELTLKWVQSDGANQRNGLWRREVSGDTENLLDISKVTPQASQTKRLPGHFSRPLSRYLTRARRDSDEACDNDVWPRRAASHDDNLADISVNYYKIVRPLLV